MNQKFEQFFRDHREEFDAEEPRKELWNEISRKLPGGASGNIPRISLYRWGWVAAAVLLLMLSISVYLQLSRPGPVPGEKGAAAAAANGSPDIIREIDPQAATEVVNFTRLIEGRQAALKGIEKDHPNLYREFTGDINKLDSSYRALKDQLPVNPNREQLLDAMIQNLQLQAELLNRQLQIIQQIKESKNKNNETNSKIG